MWRAHAPAVNVSEAKQSIAVPRGKLDCFVASLLAMTIQWFSWVPALRRTAEEALHRVRDTRLRQLPAQRALRLLGRDDGLMELACRRNGVPRMLRSAPRLRR